jgi:hypothetical protein
MPVEVVTAAALSVVLLEWSVIAAAETVVFPRRLATPLAIMVPVARC